MGRKAELASVFDAAFDELAGTRRIERLELVIIPDLVVNLFVVIGAIDNTEHRILHAQAVHIEQKRGNGHLAVRQYSTENHMADALDPDRIHNATVEYRGRGHRLRRLGHELLTANFQRFVLRLLLRLTALHLLLTTTWVEYHNSRPMGRARNAFEILPQ